MFAGPARLRNFFFALLLAALVLEMALRLVPFPVDKLMNYPEAVVITDREGAPLRVRLGPGDLDGRPGYQFAPDDWIAKAVVAAEDQRFWSHHGVDPVALVRAVLQNVAAWRRISGASTISTQVIRLIDPRPRHLGTKLIEAFRAVQLERLYTKEEILAFYLDRAPFGGNKVGIEAAAQRYYAKRAGDLSLGEAALLAGLPQSPSRLRPDRYPARARKRQGYVLNRMAALGMIDASQQTAALAVAPDVRLAPYPQRAPHFTDWVGVPMRRAPGEPLRTTLDPALQTMAEQTLQRHLAARAADYGAVVILDVASGAVRAMVGSPDFAEPRAGQVNAAVAVRAAGSTLKPFAFALAVDRGLMTPQTMIADQRVVFSDFEPGNFDPTYRGRVTLHDALVLSLNLPAIEVARRVGAPLFHRTLRSLGLQTIDQPASHYGVGLVLGNAGVRLLDLANAYACLARGGTWLPVRAVEDSPVGTSHRIFSEEAAWIITDMLSGDERAEDTTGHTADVRLPPMAWKTGTSAGLRDAWTIAYNPAYVVGVWIGDPRGAPSEVLVGRLIATPLAWDIFRQVYPDNNGPWHEKPERVIAREVCAASGHLAGGTCTHRTPDWQIAGVTRTMVCAAHGAGGAGEGGIVRAEVTEPEPSVRITSPAGGTTFRLLDAMDGLAQQIALQARAPGNELYWFINDQLVGQTTGDEPVFWPLQRGTHQIVCASPAGSADRVTIDVQ